LINDQALAYAAVFATSGTSAMAGGFSPPKIANSNTFEKAINIGKTMFLSHSF